MQLDLRQDVVIQKQGLCNAASRLSRAITESHAKYPSAHLVSYCMDLKSADSRASRYVYWRSPGSNCHQSLR
jgi:hypothetical protein